MPPLAHLLAPQIMTKAREIEAELGPPIAPKSVGYFAQQNIGFEKTPYDPRGLVDKPEGKSYDSSRTPVGQMADGVGVMQRSGDPIAQRVGRAFLAGMHGKVAGKEGSYKAPEAGRAVDAKGKGSLAMLMPFPDHHNEPIGMDERGAAVFRESSATYNPAPEPQRGPLRLKRGEAVGIDEKGESVDRKGKKLGYLASPTAPMGTVAGKGRELPMKDLARRKVDAPMDRRDAFGASALKQLYESHLKALQDNFQDTGVEAFPQGYFNGMSKEKRKDIEQGVKALREMERGQPA